MLTREQEEEVRAKARQDFTLKKAKQLAQGIVDNEARKLSKGSHVTIPPPEIVNEITVTPSTVNNVVEPTPIFNSVDLLPLIEMLKEQREADRKAQEEHRRREEAILARVNDSIEALASSFVKLISVLSAQEPPTVEVNPSAAVTHPPRPKALRIEEDQHGVKRLIPEY